MRSAATTRSTSGRRCRRRSGSTPATATTRCVISSGNAILVDKARDREAQRPLRVRDGDRRRCRCDPADEQPYAPRADDRQPGRRRLVQVHAGERAGAMRARADQRLRPRRAELELYRGRRRSGGRIPAGGAARAGGPEDATERASNTTVHRIRAHERERAPTGARARARAVHPRPTDEDYFSFELTAEGKANDRIGLLKFERRRPAAHRTSLDEDGIRCRAARTPSSPPLAAHADASTASPRASTILRVYSTIAPRRATS